MRNIRPDLQGARPMEFRTFLSSSEGPALSGVYECTLVGSVRFGFREHCTVVRLSPPIPRRVWNLEGTDIELVVLANRHAGETVVPVSSWPLCVHMLVPHSEINMASIQELTEADLLLNDWGELYRTHDDAMRKAL